MLPKLIFGYFILINLTAFFACFLDKRRAKRHRYRIPERRLFLFSAAGGALGFLFGMLLFRHKTQHLSFRIIIPLLSLLWAVVWVLLATKLFPLL